MKNYLLFLLIFSVGFFKSQNTVTLLDNVPGIQHIVTCDSIFLDPGGDGTIMDLVNYYPHNVNDTITFCPDVEGKKIRFIVDVFEMQIGDFLKVYDGSTATSSNFLSTYTFIPAPLSEMNLLVGDTIQASSFNLSGCLTFVFTSDNDNHNDVGWKFNVSCIIPCQEIIGVGTINGINMEDSIFRLCRGDELTLAGFGIFPDMGTISQFYDQNNETSTFTWLIEGPVPGSTMGVFNPTTGFSEVTHQFQDSGIYHLVLEIKDSLSEFECFNRNYLHNVVYVSGPPLFSSGNVFIDTTQAEFLNVFLGDTNYLVGVIDTFFHFDDCTPPSSTMKLIPDGSEIGGLNTIELEIEFNCYGTQIIDEISDIESICLDLEHSASGDLEIVLECPSGISIVLLESSIINNGNFGTPTLVGVGMGTPETYCFTSSASQTLNEAATGVPGGQMVPNNPALPLESFSNLIGCPINGIWKLKIKDTRINDDGYVGIFHIDLNDNINFSSDTIFYNTYVDSNWVEDPANPSLGIQLSPLSNGDTLFVSPTLSGFYSYKFEIIDNFGCTYDTIVTFNVINRKQADFTYINDTLRFCELSNDTLFPTFLPGFMNVMGEAGTFSATPNGLALDPLTGIINISTSLPGIYVIQNSVLTLGPTTEIDNFQFQDTLIILPNPTIVASSDFSTICTENSVEFTANGGISYTLNGIPFINSNSTNQIIINNNSISELQNFNVIGYDENNCSASQIIQILVGATTTSNDNVSACVSYTWPFNNQTYSFSGIYIDTIPSTLTCDSIRILDLTIGNYAVTNQNITTCYSYTWPQNNQTYSNSGIYYDTITGNWGCDSVFILNLTINNATYSTINMDTCGIFHWNLNNQNYVTNSTYSTTITNANGCDSIVTLNITFSPTIINLNTSNDTISYGQSTKIYTAIYNENGVYSWLSNGNVISVNDTLTVNPSQTTTYYLQFVDALNNCSNTLDSITIFVKEYKILKIFVDLNGNCIKDSEDIDLPGIITTINPGNYTALSNQDGEAVFEGLTAGTYVVEIDSNNNQWNASCSYSLNYTFADSDTIGFIGLTQNSVCIDPNVSFYVPFLRRCLTNQYMYLNVENQATANDTITNSYVELELNEYMTILNASSIFTTIGENLYRFDLTDLAPGITQDILIYFHLSCDAELGQTLCMEANLKPTTICVLDEEASNFSFGVTPCTIPWDHSSLSVESWCANDSIHFSVTNNGENGNGNMLCYSPVRVYKDGVLSYFDSIQLQGGETKFYTYISNGETWNLQADQHPLHPGNSNPNAHIEACGNSVNWSTNQVNNLPLNDSDPIVDIFCDIVTGSYDPNDKKGTPFGVGINHDIMQNQQIQYAIRFQNTGTDTAFTVVIRDTLDTDLDIFSVVSGVSSHDYQFTILGQRVLEWTFNNIMLPDSSTNEPASNGFVTYQVEQLSNLPNGTEITNTANIYFDFNEPIRTNTSFHTINNQLSIFIANMDEIKNSNSGIIIYPNPTSGKFTISGLNESEIKSVEVYDQIGRNVLQLTSTTKIDLSKFENGIYHILIKTQDAEFIKKINLVR